MGGLLAVGYLLLFQLAGVFFVSSVLREEERMVPRLLIGSAFGNLLLMWIPALWAFLFGFTAAAHIAAALTVAAAGAAVWFLRRPKFAAAPKMRLGDFLRERPDVLFPFALWLLFVFLVFHGFRYRDGAIYSSQCTYGDMNMHLGFITSIAEQGFFPPEYSILPGTQLGYPFLSDSISSSLYLLGAPLLLAYALPMLLAAAHVFFGGWLLFCMWLKKPGPVSVAMMLFFLNGGFGFAYFLSGSRDNPQNFLRIFSAFYETPTNYVEQNIRWVNVIVDIMLPQRASLFGWSLLFPAMYLLFRAVFKGEKSYFPLAGVFAGAMVMVHTHSFLALGIISGVWLLFSLGKFAYPKDQSGFLHRTKRGAYVLFAIPVLAQFLVPAILPRRSDVFLWATAALAGLFVLVLLFLLIKVLRNGKGRAFAGWGIYLIVTLVLALPQLLGWTFFQVSGAGSFVRGWYNWSNQGDSYFWFYLVNLGIFGLLVIPALFAARGSAFRLAGPAVVIWFICEFVVFQPNEYDNNKLLYIAYFLLCGPVAGFAAELFEGLRTLPYRRVLLWFFVLFCTLSAVLTIGRESVAEYQLYSKSQMDAAQYISENAEPDDTVLTGTRHNNEIAALTGRNIVCGSGTFLYFHGIDYSTQNAAVLSMYMDPAGSAALFDRYSVDYVMVSSYERSDYGIDGSVFASLYEKVYDDGETQIYAVSAR